MSEHAPDPADSPDGSGGSRPSRWSAGGPGDGTSGGSSESWPSTYARAGPGGSESAGDDGSPVTTHREVKYDLPEGAPVDYETNHWRGVGAVAFFMGGLGLLLQRPALLLSGVLGVVYAGYAGSAQPPRTRGDDGKSVVAIERRLSDATPNPGETVAVRVTVRNAGEGFLPDVRLVDGVPPALEVVRESPRHATALRGGEAVTFAYEVTVPRGEHRWRPAHLVVADPSGEVERETTVRTDTAVRAVPPVLATEELPLRDLTSPYTGRVETDAGGDGVEFHATREYLPSDPLRRIDWYRKAKTGELGTLEFREERSATVVILVDARKPSYLAPAAGEPHAVDRSVEAATQTFSALLDTGDRVGVAVFGRGGAWLAPGAGEEHRARGRDLFATHPSLSSIPPEKRTYESLLDDREAELRDRRIDRLDDRLPDDAQVFVLSPCCDEYPSEVVRRLDAYGHRITLVSPDPTGDRSPEQRLARLERADRFRALRRDGVRVLDWPRGESFRATLERARARWSR